MDTKYLNLIKLVLILGALLFVVDKLTKTDELHKELLGTKQELKVVKENAALLEVNYQENLKDLAKTKETLKGLESVIGGLEGRIRVLSDATYIIKERARKTGKSDAIYETEDGTYLINELRFNNGPAIGFVTIAKNGDVFSKLYDHEIGVSNIISVDDRTGRYQVLNSASWTLRSPTLTNAWKDKPFPLKIRDGVAFVDPVLRETKSRLRLWNPSIGVSTQLASNPHISMGLAMVSYGKSNSDADFRFLELGLSYREKELKPYVSPVLYRPFGKVLHNTYIGPYFLYDNGFKPYLGIRVGL